VKPKARRSRIAGAGLFCLALAFVPISLARGPAPESALPAGGVTGTVKRHAAFASKLVEPRNVDVWLPPGYDREPKKRYAVLYMHDGQNLFDPATSYGGVDWGVDEVMTMLIAEGEVRETIVVGVWNSPKRFLEYMPQRAVPNGDASTIEGIPAEMKGPILSDAYLKFLVHELKPFVDATYRTRTGRDDTFVMGSSMGGLISLYALCEYPKVFGGAGCVSTHWPAGDGIVVEYLKKSLPRAGSHKIYFDFGTETLDAKYEPFQMRADDVMRRAGYRENRDWMTRKFTGAEHSERSWRQRVDVPLIFLLGR
jgi:predicted alpha/beta superfamily hydrolase